MVPSPRDGAPGVVSGDIADTARTMVPFCSGLLALRIGRDGQGRFGSADAEPVVNDAPASG